MKKHSFINNKAYKEHRLYLVQAICSNSNNYDWCGVNIDKQYVIKRDGYCLVVNPDGRISSYNDGAVNWHHMEQINDTWVNKIDTLIHELANQQ